MAWKKEYAEARKIKSTEDPEYRAKRNAQGAKDKEARKAYMNAYYKNNRDKWNKRTPEKQAEHNANRRVKYAEDQEFRNTMRTLAREWQLANPIKRKAQRLKQYGMTHDEFISLMESQGGKCAICGHNDTSSRKFFPVVDHCHNSKKVRGLLCANCNRGIGMFQDNPDLLRLAAEYLLSHG